MTPQSANILGIRNYSHLNEYYDDVWKVDPDKLYVEDIELSNLAYKEEYQFLCARQEGRIVVGKTHPRGSKNTKRHAYAIMEQGAMAILRADEIDMDLVKLRYAPRSSDIDPRKIFVRLGHMYRFNPQLEEFIILSRLNLILDSLRVFKDQFDGPITAEVKFTRYKQHASITLPPSTTVNNCAIALTWLSKCTWGMKGFDRFLNVDYMRISAPLLEKPSEGWIPGNQKLFDIQDGEISAKGKEPKHDDRPEISNQKREKRKGWSTQRTMPLTQEEDGATSSDGSVKKQNPKQEYQWKTTNVVDSGNPGKWGNGVARY